MISYYYYYIMTNISSKAKKCECPVKPPCTLVTTLSDIIEIVLHKNAPYFKSKKILIEYQRVFQTNYCAKIIILFIYDLEANSRQKC